MRLTAFLKTDVWAGGGTAGILIPSGTASRASASSRVTKGSSFRASSWAGCDGGKRARAWDSTPWTSSAKEA